MIRVCPKRDAVCPHGMDCPFTIDRYSCADEPRDGERYFAGGTKVSEIAEFVREQMRPK